ncbi:urea transporter [Couchioplanes caeruleus]|uniref:urea transporter n=1 Tax=Couchioplanes caeruleus TaxID=56438 RepID=UPI00201C2518|nr:urea transporter [Couchioplanes caeruleus]UQU67593.1 urea transporter [Couchioplanes caeruleus]
MTVRFLDAMLRGVSQVFLQNNPMSGLIVLTAVSWGAVAARTPQAAAGAVVGLFVGTLTATVLRFPSAAVRNGLFGFNPLLTGLAISIYLPPRILTWVYLVLGAVVCTLITRAIAAILDIVELPVLTFPFVLTTWLLLLAAYQFTGLGNRGPGEPALPHGPGAADVHLTGAFLTAGILKDISEVFLLGNWVTGALILPALLITSRWAAGFAVAGAVVSTFVALGLGADATVVAGGLYGFSAVLTAVALGATFYHPSRRRVPYVLLGVVFTVVVQAALGTALGPVGVPALTAPFVFVTWLFALSQRDPA